MASEYLKKKYKDVKPDVPRELTKEEKRKNWWDYNKWIVAGGIVALLLAANLIWDVMGRGEPKPDYQVAYVGEGSLPNDTITALEAGFASLGDDLNGDGQVLVRVRQYASNPGSDPSIAAATSVQLMADIMECESFFFLLEDPESFQESYHTLCRLDGSLPEESDNSVENAVLVWKDCPALAGLDLGSYTENLFGSELTGSNQDLVSSLFIARRGFWKDQDAEYQNSYLALWERVTAGAVS